MADDSLAFVPAPSLMEALRRGDVLPVDVVDAQLAQIDRLDRGLRAFITVSASVRDEAVAAAKRFQKGRRPRLLEGLTVAVKDVIPTAGLRTTYGSTAFAEDVPTDDALVVDRLRRAGALVIGKTSTPEFAAQVNTTNALVGTTLNPWDTRFSSGGSSGGSAVALATGMATLALGTDHGGSVRFPASWNNVVGLRPTPGRVPMHPNPWLSDPFDVVGPLARTVGGVRMLLGAISGEDLRVPITAPVDASGHAGPLRIAWTPDLGGLIAVDPDVRDVLTTTVADLARLDVRVDEATPRLADAIESIRPLRAFRSLIVHADRLGSLDALDNERLRASLADARKVSVEAVAKAERARSRALELNATFFEQFDVLALPTTQYVGLPSASDVPVAIEGRPVEDPFDSSLATYAITMMGWPAISVPGGFTTDGMPVGLQLVGPRGAELRIIELAELFEGVRPHHRRVPPIVDTMRVT